MTPLRLLALFASYMFLAGHVACGTERIPTVDEIHPSYGLYEGVNADNTCSGDQNCVVSGCSSEICAAEALASACIVLDDPPTGMCGCVSGLCQWFAPH